MLNFKISLNRVNNSHFADKFISNYDTINALRL